jgi:protocatechuate 3,4-dioxygenase beta subunit
MFSRNNSKKETEPVVEGLLPIVQDRLQKEVFGNSAGESLQRNDDEKGALAFLLITVLDSRFMKNMNVSFKCNILVNANAST